MEVTYIYYLICFILQTIPCAILNAYGPEAKKCEMKFIKCEDLEDLIDFWGEITAHQEEERKFEEVNLKSNDHLKESMFQALHAFICF